MYPLAGRNLETEYRRRALEFELAPESVTSQVTIITLSASALIAGLAASAGTTQWASAASGCTTQWASAASGCTTQWAIAASEAPRSGPRGEQKPRAAVGVWGGKPQPSGPAPATLPPLPHFFYVQTNTDKKSPPASERASANKKVNASKMASASEGEVWVIQGKCDRHMSHFPGRVRPPRAFVLRRWASQDVTRKWNIVVERS
ncbi:hypothetical protein R3P38DRAFT_3600663 [Favolaschia claudopus]|uniref:Uncharacterized protein n=1 Tax=Favolaschia claudopus TaxID=2862362 RepID=A0AAW0ACQ9_9AGAR